MIEEAEKLLNPLNALPIKANSLSLKNLPMNKRFSFLSNKSIEIENFDKVREIMTRQQSEKAHIKIYFGQFILLISTGLKLNFHSFVF